MGERAGRQSVHARTKVIEKLFEKLFERLLAFRLPNSLSSHEAFMKPDIRSPQQKQSDARLGYGLIMAFMSIGGAIAGIIICAVAGGFAQPWLGFSFSLVDWMA